MDVMGTVREDHVRFTSELSRHSNEMSTTTKDAPRTDKENRELYDLALEGLQVWIWTGYVVWANCTYYLNLMVEIRSLMPSIKIKVGDTAPQSLTVGQGQ